MNTAFVTAIVCFVIAVTICLWTLLAGRKAATKKRPASGVSRAAKNPVISPLPYREWEANGTFNPGAFEDDEKTVHLMYRAIGEDGVSRIGHASSKDGVHFGTRSSFPVFQSPQNASISASGAKELVQEYNPSVYASGGSWGGAEDPRTVLIGDRVYMIYVAFGGWDSARLALTSIKMNDVKKGKWDWKRPVLISPKGHFYKNWLLFPEKINGRYALVHSIEPTVMIEYFDDFNEFQNGKQIISRHPGDQKERRAGWDSKVRGGGPPPLKTDIGWLLLYHATDKKDPGKYKVGAMILDSNDPTKVLYRAPEPILSPDMPYENDGKPGVVYASGAVIRDGNLFIYYGGGDRHTCVAETPLKQLMDWMVKYGKV